MKLSSFITDDFHSALKYFFSSLNVPLDYISKESISPPEILKSTLKAESPSFKLINDVYFLGIVDDAVFEGNSGFNPENIKTEYDGILIFGVTLHKREKALLPTRSQLAEITRAFNREYHYTPVVVVLYV